MLPGPVFAFELLTTARRGRFYLARAFYALVLLIILWTVFTAWSQASPGELTISQVRWFAISVFFSITIGQEILVLVLAPVLVAGVIADEKQRKTLHYLLASRLTGPEIVLGKLLVRMLYVGALLGVSLPVLSLLVLLGGIDPRLVLLATAATFSTAWFLAALSVWVSTIARRPREALFVAYGLECVWLFSSLVLRQVLTIPWPAIDAAARLIADWVGASSPVDVYWQFALGMATGGAVGRDAALLFWMIGLQLSCGAVLACLASIQLRPLFRRQQGAGEVRRAPWLTGVLRPRRFGGLPAVGDRPMLWKERHTGGPRGFARLISIVLSLAGGGLLAYYSIRFGAPAVAEWWDYGPVLPPFPRSWNGYGYPWQEWVERWRFLSFISGVVPLVYLVAVVRVAGAAAAAITSEHEEDTWVSLTTTDLTGREIVVAKLLGTLGRGLWLAAVVVALAVLGAIVGSIHVLAIPALIGGLFVFGGFAAALGVWVSIQLRSTWRAQFLTISGLLLMNVAGQGIANTLSRAGFAPQVWPGFTPYELSKLVFDPYLFERVAETQWPQIWRIHDIDSGPGWLATFSILSLAGYATLGAALTWDSLRRFKIAAGRARRPRRPHPARAEPEPL
jgi:ABC-type transport system involved in multi-copper enzyme maturation permease subunit